MLFNESVKKVLQYAKHTTTLLFYDSVVKQHQSLVTEANIFLQYPNT